MLIAREIRNCVKCGGNKTVIISLTKIVNEYIFKISRCVRCEKTSSIGEALSLEEGDPVINTFINQLKDDN